jgi:transposase
MAPTYGRSERGQRVNAAKPADPGTHVTLTGALSLRGIEAIMTLEGASNTAVFEAYISQMLVPILKSNHIVIMDNVSFHKSSTIVDAIEATGAQIKFLPPYSPDLNPIESCWSKIKEGLRRAQARTRQALDEAVAQLADKVTPSDAQGWFGHSGYVT